MRTKDKNLVYIEDFVWEIMQYPSHTVPKSAIKDCAKDILTKRRVTVWKHLCNIIKDLFSR
jgi:hypothetical protein